jgi:hypothetical protein
MAEENFAPGHCYFVVFISGQCKGLFGYIGLIPAGNDTYNKKIMIYQQSGFIPGR